MSARILVTGSRTWTDKKVVGEALKRAWLELRDRGPVVLVHGDCPNGADRIARDIWRDQGLPDEPHPARWAEHGRRAGFVRNADMAKTGADLCLAFAAECATERCDRPRPHSSHGTAMTIDLCRAAGIETRVYLETPTQAAAR